MYLHLFESPNTLCNTDMYFLDIIKWTHLNCYKCPCMYNCITSELTGSHSSNEKCIYAIILTSCLIFSVVEYSLKKKIKILH